MNDLQKPIVYLWTDAQGRRWWRVDCSGCIYGSLESTRRIDLERGYLCSLCKLAGKSS